MKILMDQATRRMRPLAAVFIVAASLVTSVSISALSTGGGTDVGVSAVAKQSADRTGIRSTTQDSMPAPPSTVPPQAARVLELMNAERTMRGLQPLVFESRLFSAAQAHTVHQAEVGTIFHIAPDGTGPGDRITATGYEPASWSENVAAGQVTPESVLAAWMASSGHCRNILNPGYTEVGIGYVESTTSFRYWWTQKFARPIDAAVPPGVFDSAWC